MTKQQINPYNFVPLGNGPKRGNGPNWYQLRQECLSGLLQCELECLSPLISLDHRSAGYHEQSNASGVKTGIKLREFGLLRNKLDQVILQSTSIKGVVRSVYETITDSCLPLAAVVADNYRYDQLNEYDHAQCNSLNNLCPACRLFGTIHGNIVHCQGRVTFTDATLVTTDKLIKYSRFLKELSTPHPYHTPTYSCSNSPGRKNPIAGRKFYYQQGENPSFWIPEENSNKRTIVIREYVLPKSKFSFQVFLDNLEVEEFGKLLLAIELDEGLGHKLGLGKAVGLGGCRVTINWNYSIINKGETRYNSWIRNEKNETWSELKADVSILPPALVEILRTNKIEEGDIGYPVRDPHTGYPQEAIDTRGVFGGDETTYGVPTKLQLKPVQPSENPPVPKDGQRAVWLVAIDDKNLLFKDIDGKEHSRKQDDFQGKRNLLEVGRWYLLQGNKSVLPVKKK